MHNFTLSAKCFVTWWILPCAILSWWSFAELSLVSFSVRIQSDKTLVNKDKMRAQFYLVYQMFRYLVDFTLCNIIMMVICRVVSCDFFCQNPFKQNISEVQRYVCSILYYLPHNSYVGYLPYAILSWWSYSASFRMGLPVRIHSQKT